MQDEAQNAEQTVEIKPEAAPASAPAGGKKGGKQAVKDTAPAPVSDLAREAQSISDRVTSRLTEQLKPLNITVLGIERSLDKRLGGVTDDVEAMRILMLDMDKRLKALETEAPKRDGRLLDAISKYEKSVLKSLEATVAACEALTGMRPADARIVRQLIRELREAKDGKGRAATPTSPSQASRSAFWTGGRTAIAFGTAVAVALGWLLLS